MKICSGYLGLACIDDVCPKAIFEEYRERNYPVVTPDCDECPHYKGCEDCYFKDTGSCIKNEN